MFSPKPLFVFLIFQSGPLAIYRASVFYIFLMHFKDEKKLSEYVNVSVLATKNVIFSKTAPNYTTLLNMKAVI